MLSRVLAHWLESGDSEKIRSWVYLIQAVLGASAILAMVWLRSQGKSSGFRVREADQKKKQQAKAQAGPDLLGQAKYAPRAAPLRLAGIVLDGAPHEVLGLSPHASEADIQKAYRDLMKQYHPDKVGPQGSREWQDASRIAHAISEARNRMLAGIKTKK